MTPSSPTVREIAEGLSDLERELFMGTATGWGSWMFTVGHGLVAKGLGTARDGSIWFDTPLAKQVKAHLETHHGS